MAIPRMTLGVMIFSLIYKTQGQSGGFLGAIVNNDDPAITYMPSFCPKGDILTCYGAWLVIYLDGGEKAELISY